MIDNVIEQEVSWVTNKVLQNFKDLGFMEVTECAITSLIDHQEIEPDHEYTAEYKNDSAILTGDTTEKKLQLKF